jgi:hypothetical protein
LATVEASLVRWCVLELDIGPEALQRLFSSLAHAERSPRLLDQDQLDHVVNPATYQALWGWWAGREQEFFQACGSLVEPLTWQEVSAIGGPEIQICARLAREAYMPLMAEEIPPQLQVGSFTTVHMGPEVCRVSS